MRTAMSALGDRADHAMLAGEERDDLRGLAVFGLAQTDAAIAEQGHEGIIGIVNGAVMSIAPDRTSESDMGSGTTVIPIPSRIAAA